eukprot:768214-Hanusia_phi.AAC.7
MVQVGWSRSGPRARGRDVTYPRSRIGSLAPGVTVRSTSPIGPFSTIAAPSSRLRCAGRAPRAFQAPRGHLNPDRRTVVCMRISCVRARILVCFVWFGIKVSRSRRSSMLCARGFPGFALPV